MVQLDSEPLAAIESQPDRVLGMLLLEGGSYLRERLGEGRSGKYRQRLFVTRRGTGQHSGQKHRPYGCPAGGLQGLELAANHSRFMVGVF